jgi:hypothetical protein
MLWHGPTLQNSTDLGAGLLGLGGNTILLRPRPGVAPARKADIGNKLDYVFGRATGNPHNIARSQDMLRQMESIGLTDNPDNRRYMERFFQNVLNDPTNVAEIQPNGRIVRESLLMGPRGGLKVVSVWEGDRLITVVLIGGK